MIPAFAPIGWSTDAPIQKDFRGLFFSLTSTSAYTFSNIPLGDAYEKRFVLVGITGRVGSSTTRTITSVTIGGVAATQIQLDNNTSGGNQTILAFYGALVPAGVSANVVVTFNASMALASVAAWTLKNLKLESKRSGMADLSAPYSASLDVKKGGIVAAISLFGATSIQWSSPLILDQTLVASGSTQVSAASLMVDADNSALSVNADVTGAATINSQFGTSFISFR